MSPLPLLIVQMRIFLSVVEDVVHHFVHVVEVFIHDVRTFDDGFAIDDACDSWTKQCVGVEGARKKFICRDVPVVRQNVLERVFLVFWIAYE